MENSISEIEKLVIAGSGQQFSGLIGPGVYVFLCNDLPVYVGMSRNNLLGRASSSSHHRWLDRKECDQIKLFPCKNWGTASDLEQYLIDVFQPKYNRRKKNRKVASLLGIC